MALILKQCPIGEPAPGKFGRGEAMHQSATDLITAADLVSLNAAALPHDLNGAIPEGQVHILGRSAASGEGVDQHRVSVSFLDIVARWGGSPQAHGGEEGNGGRTLSGAHGDEPGPVLLKNAVAGFAVLCQDGIQTGLGSVGLPPTIEQADEIVTDLSDQIAMESDLCHVIGVGHAGIGAAPVLAVGDGGVHLGFDLTHVWVLCG